MNEQDVRNITRKFFDEQHLLDFIKIFEKEHNLFRGSHDKIQLPAALDVPEQVVNNISGKTKLEDLEDVSIPTKTTGDFIQYSEATEKWTRQAALAEGSIVIAVADGYFSEDNTNFTWDNTSKIFKVIGSTFLDGAVVINDSNADVDFRVEGSGASYTHLLFTDASANKVGINEDAPKALFHIRGATCADYAGLHPYALLLIEASGNVAIQLQGDTDAAANIIFADDDYNPPAGRIQYSFNSDEMTLGMGGNVHIYLTGTKARFHLTNGEIELDSTGVAKITSNSHNADAYFALEEDEALKWTMGFDYSDGLPFQICEGVPGTNIVISIPSGGGSLNFLRGADKGLQYLDTGDTTRWMLRVATSTNVVEILNRASHGKVEIHANAAEAGAGGDVLVATFEDDIITLAVDLRLSSNKELRFYDNGNYVGFEAPALDANQIWVLPAEDGDADDFLQTDGAGNLSFAPGGGGAATFLDLTDTPGAYATHGLETLRVNFAEDAIEFYVQTDQYVKVDGGAASGYLGVAAGDGVLRTEANITVTDGGNFITLDTVQGIGTGDSPTFAGLTVTNILFYDLVDYNFVFGSSSGLNLTGGSAKTNVLMGFECGKEVTTGDYNVAFGHQALWRDQTGSNNVAIGYRALYGTVGQHGTKNTAIGYKALQSAYGTGNYGLGSDAGVGITSGTYNVCIGQSAGGGISVGHQNVAIGGYCMGNASGSYNTCIGPYSGRMLTGLYNVAFGREAIRYGTSVQNSVAIGRMASYRNVEGDENVMVGYQCGYGSGAGVDYHDNVGVGAYALWGIGEQGNKNIAIGWEAGYSISTGQGNVCIGYRAGKTNLTTDSNELWIANTDTATPLIYGEFDNEVLQFNTTLLGFHKVTPVVQQAHIVDADGSLADITTKYNALLSYLEAYGFLAAA